MTIIVGVIVALLIGIQAQVSKGRTGALWGFLTLLVYVGLWIGTDAASFTDPELRVNPNRQLAVALVAGTISLIVGFLVVLTLPQKGTKTEPSSRA
jgi:membrane protease YdiL (CAAX protease family)